MATISAEEAYLESLYTIEEPEEVKPVLFESQVCVYPCVPFAEVEIETCFNNILFYPWS